MRREWDGFPRARVNAGLVGAFAQFFSLFSTLASAGADSCNPGSFARAHGSAANRRHEQCNRHQRSRAERNLQPCRLSSADLGRDRRKSRQALRSFELLEHATHLDAAASRHRRSRECDRRAVKRHRRARAGGDQSDQSVSDASVAERIARGKSSAFASRPLSTHGGARSELQGRIHTVVCTRPAGSASAHHSRLSTSSAVFAQLIVRLTRSDPQRTVTRDAVWTACWTSSFPARRPAQAA